MCHTLINCTIVARRVANKGEGLLECLENIIPHSFQCDFPNKTPYNVICNKHITKMLRHIHNYEYKWYFDSIAKTPNMCLVE
jgi:hypothetical protein